MIRKTILFLFLNNVIFASTLAAPAPWEVRPDVNVSAEFASNIKKNAEEQKDFMKQWYNNRMVRQLKSLETIENMKQAAFQGDKSAQYEIAVFYQTGLGVRKDNQKAIFWYQESAKAGYSAAQYALALIYRSDQTAQNIEQANFWHYKAAKNGYAKAQYSLGVLLVNERQINQAKKWFQKAAEQGHIAAKLALLSV